MFVKKGMAVLVCAIMFGSVGVSVAQAKKWKTCKTFVNRGEGIGAYDWSAKSKARVSWRAKVLGYYGAGYATWSMAKDAKYKCKTVRQKGKKRRRCVVAAKACRLGK